MPKSPFTPADRERIAKAVASAEGGTSGEIVPYFVESSDDYAETAWRGGAFLAAMALFAFYGIYQFTEVWLPFGVNLVAAIVIASGLLGALLARTIAPLRRLFAGDDLIERRVRARALQAFVDQEVFKTRERTGVLIFISNFERKVFVLGDSGINARVTPADWQAVVDRVISGIRKQQAADGLLEAIGLCGQLLNRQGVVRRGDDSDELANKLVIGE